MYELHLFIVKLIVTFSSSALVFSIGMLSLFKNKSAIKFDFLITLGWGFNLLSIVLIVIGLMTGLNLTYTYYNNIINNRDEIDQNTSTTETKIHTLVICSAVFSAISVVLILFFAYLNFLN